MACTGKESWPELLGARGEDAKSVIEAENPAVEAIIVKVGTAVILNFDCNRVWVWVDEQGIVSKVPRIG